MLGVERHLLDEAQLVVVLERPGEQVGGLVVVAAGHEDGVDLDGAEPGGAGGGQAVEDVLVAPAAGEGGEDVGAQGVEGDVDPVQARGREGAGGAGEADAVGGQREPRAGGEGGAALDDRDEAGAQQGLAAGEADLGDAEGGDGDGDEADDLVVGEQVGLGEPGEALFGHAVGAAEVAPVGEGDAQVRGDAPVGVDEHGVAPPADWNSRSISAGYAIARAFNTLSKARAIGRPDGISAPRSR